jgi:hypothetical protein
MSGAPYRPSQGRTLSIKKEWYMMHRRSFVLVALLILLVPVAAADAKSAPAYVVSGDALVDFAGVETVEWVADVTGDPATLTATGSFRQHIVAEGLDIDLTGSVDCLNVVGSTAYLSGVITASNREDIAVGTPFYTSVTDGSSTGAVDIVGPNYLNPGLTCSSTVAPEFVVTSGDLSILACSKLKNSGKCKP